MLDESIFALGQELANFNDTPHNILNFVESVINYNLSACTYSDLEHRCSTDGNDLLLGTTNEDTIYSLDGNDLIFGLSGNDILSGNQGLDLIAGGEGDDWIGGGADSDPLIGSSGNDTLVGGADDDYLWGGKDNDSLQGQSGSDWAKPTLFPPETLRERDRLWGNSGDDRLDGGTGFDRLFAGEGNDILIDTDGGDRLTGGKGKDEFRIGNGRLPDTPKIAIYPPVPDFTIADFEVGKDILNFNLWLNFDDLIINDTENGAIISVEGREGLVLLEGVKAADLIEESFRFAHPELAADLQSSLDRIVAESGIPGATVAVTTPDGYTWVGASGFSQLETETPMQPDDPFKIGSITKTFVSVVTLQQAEEGKLSLDHTIDQWLPDEVASMIPNSDRITIGQLLNHTSGIVDYQNSEVYQNAIAADPTRVWQPEERLAYVSELEPYFEPGEGWQYSASNYQLLGLIVGEATDSTIASQIQARIAEPLGLDSTFLFDGENIPSNLVRGYQDVFQQDGSYGQDGILDDVTAANTASNSASGGIISTAEEVVRFTQALFNGELLNPHLLKEMLNFVDVPDYQVGDLAFDSYGLGLWQYSTPSNAVWGHDGQVIGYKSQMAYLPDLGIAGVALINQRDTPVETQVEILLKSLGIVLEEAA